MRMRWLVAMFLGLALLTGQVVPLTIGPLTVGHVPSVFAAANDDNHGERNGGNGVGGGTGDGKDANRGQHEGPK